MISIIDRKIQESLVSKDFLMSISQNVCNNNSFSAPFCVAVHRSLPRDFGDASLLNIRWTRGDRGLLGVLRGRVSLSLLNVLKCLRDPFFPLEFIISQL